MSVDERSGRERLGGERSEVEARRVEKGGGDAENGGRIGSIRQRVAPGPEPVGSEFLLERMVADRDFNFSHPRIVTAIGVAGIVVACVLAKLSGGSGIWFVFAPGLLVTAIGVAEHQGLHRAQAWRLEAAIDAILSGEGVRNVLRDYQHQGPPAHLVPLLVTEPDKRSGATHDVKLYGGLLYLFVMGLIFL